MSIRLKFILVLWAIVAAVSGIFAYALFTAHETEYLEGVDGKLLTAATMAKTTLPEGYHDKITGKDSVAPGDYLKIVDTYNRICLETGLQYIWSVMAVDGKIHFTSGTSTSKDVTNGDHALFYDVHADPSAFAGVLESGTTEFSTFKNQWGHGRMVLIPDVDNQGRIVIYGASISIADLSVRTSGALKNAATIFLIVLAAGTAISIALTKTITQPIVELTNIAGRIAAGNLDQRAHVTGGEEISSLSRSLNAMAYAIKERIDELEQKKRQLEDARNTLEDRVKERTRELEVEIAERADVEEKLRKLSRVVSQSPVTVVITDTEATIEYVNPRFEIDTGYSREEALGKNPRILRSPNTPPETYQDLWTTITRGDVWHNEIQNKRKDGTLYWSLLTISPIRDRENHVTHYVALHEDITAQKKTEAALRIAKEQAEAANRAKSEFLSSMSHELRTPLNGILGFAQLLEFQPNDKLSEQQSNYVNHILSAGNHLLELINEVLDLSKIETGNFALNIETIHPMTEIVECLSIVMPLASKNGVVVVNDIENKDGFPLICVDAGRFRQVLVNLISNAIKYNRPGGMVTIDCQASPETVSALRFLVTDTGPGIPQEKIPELFQPFNRLGAEGGTIEGTGIGLTITKTLVTHMNGRIGVESTVGKGSTFWVEFPIATQDQMEKAQQQDDAEAADRKTTEKVRLIEGKHTVLYVEDNPRNMDLMVELLSHSDNVALLTAQTAEEGLRLAEKTIPDAIILDINLPDMDGYEALKKIQQMEGTWDIPVIALSASAMPKDVTRGLKAGFQTYLTKPLEIGKMLRALNVALKSNLREDA